MKRNKVLHVTHTMDPKAGGVCQAIRSIISGLSDLNTENEVVSLDVNNEMSLWADSFPLHKIGIGIGPWAYNKNLVPWLMENFPRFDTVILHGMWLYNAYALNKSLKIYRKGLKSKNNRSILFCVMPHGMLDPYFQKDKSRRLKAIRNWMYWKLFEAKIINNADALLFTCEEECRLAKEPFRPYHPKKEIVVGLGIENPPLYNVKMSNDFLERCPGIANSRYLLFLSRIHEKKGVDILINAYASLIESSEKQRDLKLVIAGPGLDSYYGKIVKQLVANNNILKGQVFFSGMLTADAKWGAIYGSEAFVLPSHQENFGIAVVEAMACGKTVLISNQVNIWQEIVEWGAGLVNDDTLAGTKKSLNRWADFDQNEKNRFNINARKCFEYYFFKNQTATKFLCAINED